MGLSDPHDPDQTFPFQYLQRAGAGSRSLCRLFISKLFWVPCAKVYVDSYDMWADLVGHYKSPSSTTDRPIRIALDNQPALDTGGVRRQCYTNSLLPTNTCTCLTAHPVTWGQFSAPKLDRKVSSMYWELWFHTASHKMG